MGHGGRNVLMKILYTFVIKFNRDVISMSHIDLANHGPQYQHVSHLI